MIKNKAVPPLRRDLNISTVQEDGKELLVINDPISIATQPIVITPEFYMFLQNFDGIVTRDDIEQHASQELDGDLDFNPVFEQVDMLDKLMYLESESYFIKRKEIEEEFLKSPVRQPVCAGGSYPADKDELERYLEGLFSSIDKDKINTGADSIIAPHIDFRIGEQSHKAYASAYHALRDTDADLFVIFGTSHYANTDDFMLSRKDYFTPFGSHETDKELISYLDENAHTTFSYDEFAHKPEHSIELQIVLLQHYFKGRNFKVLPILSGSFHEYIMKQSKPADDSRFKGFLNALNEGIESLSRNAAFIASVDFAHIGKKFGDEFSAEPLLSQLEEEDGILINSIEKANPEEFFEKITADRDKWKICGTAPIYSMLHARNFSKAELLSYGQWNEQETESAVSFSGIALYR